MAVEPFCHAISAGNDGLQYLCAKYSSLISRLREEVVARQRAESDAQSLQQQLQDQAEAHLAERASWEERRTALNDEIEVLSASQHGAAERRFAEAADLRHAAGANDQLSHRCDDLQRAMQDEAKKATQLTEHLAKGNEAQRRQGEELSQLRRDNVELVNQHRTVYDELISSRNQLSRARQTIVELEDQVDSLAQARQDLEAHAQQVQEELRSALRSAAISREREREAADIVGRGERQLRSNEERLSAVRTQSDKYARRAASVERRLPALATAESSAAQLAGEVKELRKRVESEAKACEAVRLNHARLEATEVYAASSAYESDARARTESELHAAAKQRASELQGELGAARLATQQAEESKLTGLSTVEKLRQEVFEERHAREDEWRRSERLTADLSQARRKLEASRAKEFKLKDVNHAKPHGLRQAPVEENRRCASSSRYSSQPRLRGVAPAGAAVRRRSCASLPRSCAPAWTERPSYDSSASTAPLPPPPRPHPPLEDVQTYVSGSVMRSQPVVAAAAAAAAAAGSATAVDALRNFIEQEDRRLFDVDHDWGESPRPPEPPVLDLSPRLPSPRLPSPRLPSPRLAPPQAPGAGASAGRVGSAATLAAQVAADRAELANLFAAQPRVLRLPNERLQHDESQQRQQPSK